MKKRIYTKIGDIFSVKLVDGEKKYFQYIANDTRQLNSNVIRIFKTKYFSDANLSEVIKDKVEFHAHTFINLGIKLDLWEKVGNVKETGNIDNILFRSTNDTISRPDEQVEFSSDWHVWRINDENFTIVGKLEGENRKSEIGVVISPNNIVHRINTGEFNFKYPKFL